MDVWTSWTQGKTPKRRKVTMCSHSDRERGRLGGNGFRGGPSFHSSQLALLSLCSVKRLRNETMSVAVHDVLVRAKVRVCAREGERSGPRILGPDKR